MARARGVTSKLGLPRASKVNSSSVPATLHARGVRRGRARRASSVACAGRHQRRAANRVAVLRGSAVVVVGSGAGGAAAAETSRRRRRDTTAARKESETQWRRGAAGRCCRLLLEAWWWGGLWMQQPAERVIASSSNTRSTTIHMRFMMSFLEPGACQPRCAIRRLRLLFYSAAARSRSHPNQRHGKIETRPQNLT